MDAPKPVNVARIIELARQRRLVRCAARIFLLLQAARQFDEMWGEVPQARRHGAVGGGRTRLDSPGAGPLHE